MVLGAEDDARLVTLATTFETSTLTSAGMDGCATAMFLSQNVIRWEVS